MNQTLRPGIDHDPVRPWNWATIVGQSNPVEIVSYPIPQDDGTETIMVRMKPGDPGSLKEVPLKAIAAFSPDRHEWWHERTRRYYGPNEFVFEDEEATP
jgi:hypothetical protein